MPNYNYKLIKVTFFNSGKVEYFRKVTDIFYTHAKDKIGCTAMSIRKAFCEKGFCENKKVLIVRAAGVLAGYDENGNLKEITIAKKAPTSRYTKVMLEAIKQVESKYGELQRQPYNNTSNAGRFYDLCKLSGKALQDKTILVNRRGEIIINDGE